MGDMYNLLPYEIKNIDELEAWKDRFLSMEYRMQLASDDISLSKYGKTNMERYNNLKTDFLMMDFNKIIRSEHNDDHNEDIDTIKSNDDTPFENIDSAYIESVIRLSNMLNILPVNDKESSLHEDVNGKYGILYVVLFSNNTLISKLIKMWTKSEFSHCAVGFDKELNDIYSFATDSDMGSKRIGFVKDSISHYHDINIKVYAIAIPFKYLYKLKKFFKDYIENSKKTSYNILAILSILIHKQLSLLNRYYDKYSMICSQFVYTVLCLCHIYDNMQNKKSYQISPKDINSILDVKQNVICSKTCKISEYNYKEFYKDIKNNIKSKDIILDESTVSDDNIISDDNEEQLSIFKNDIIPIELTPDVIFKLKDLENSGLPVLLSDLDDIKPPEDYLSADIDKLNKKFDTFNNLSKDMKELSNSSVQSILNIDNINLYSRILTYYTMKTTVMQNT
nr:MAG TPA: cysteine peptidase [Caudoviricetes sp.]